MKATRFIGCVQRSDGASHQQGLSTPIFSAEDVAQNVQDAARDLAQVLQQLAGKPLLRQKKRGCAYILPPVGFRTSIRGPSAPTMAKRW